MLSSHEKTKSHEQATTLAYLIAGIRESIFVIARYSGVLWLFRLINRNKVAIFMIHGVVDTAGGVWQPLRKRHSAKYLNRVIGTLCKSHNFIDMDQVSSIIGGKSRPPKNSIAFTIDDGYLNNLTIAYPIFRKHDVPVIIYVATGHSLTQEPFWFDRLDFAIQSQTDGSDEFQIGTSSVEITYADTDRRTECFSTLREKLKGEFSSDLQMRATVDEIAEILEKRAGTSITEVIAEDQFSKVMSPDDISASSELPCLTYGSHSVNHYRLALIPEVLARTELVSAGEDLSNWLGYETAHFAYPDGSYDDSVLRCLESLGVSTAVTVEPGLNSKGQNPYKLRRFHLPFEASDSEILALTCGFAHFLDNTVRGRIRLVRDWFRRTPK